MGLQRGNGDVRFGTLLMALTQVPSPLLDVDFDEVIAIELCDVGPPLSRKTHPNAIYRVAMELNVIRPHVTNSSIAHRYDLSLRHLVRFVILRLLNLLPPRRFCNMHISYILKTIMAHQTHFPAR